MRGEWAMIGLLGAVGCGGQRPAGGAGCAAIAQQYLAGLNAAKACDPADANSCSANVPVASSGQTAAGTTVQICNCPTAVNPGSAPRLQSLLDQFKAEGCTFALCPCPATRIPACTATAGGAGICN